MKTEIIYTEDYALIVSDKQAKENDWGYIPFEGGQVKLIGKFFADDWRKVIGYRPLNHSAWILEGVPLLPDFGLGDDVEGLAEKEYYEQSKSFEDSLVDPIFDTSRFSVVGFIDGYNKAKETYKYTEEDVAKLIHLWDMHINQHEEDKGCVRLIYQHIQSFQQPKRPKYFNPRMKEIACPDNKPGCLVAHFRKDTITNSQGQTELIGDYIYE